MKNFFNLNIKDVAIIVLIFAMLLGGGYFFKKNGDWKKQLAIEVNLKNALADSVEHYQNKEGEWVAEKLTLQIDISELEDDKLNLTQNQEQLVKRVKRLSKEKDVIVAALARQEALIDSLVNTVAIVDTVNHTVAFEATTDSLEYKIKVLNIKPFELLSPILLIETLKIPNELFIEFHWEDGKNKPVAVSITNSNPLFKTNDIDSFAIPELQKDVVKPTGWKKIGNWFKDNGKKVGIFLGGAVVGGLLIGAS